MKKNIYISATILSFALFLWSCSSKEKKSHESGLDSGFPDSGIVEPADSINAEFLTSEGIGMIRIGMICDSIPDRIAGVYDMIGLIENDEAEIYSFMLEGREMFLGYDYNDGKIDMLCLAPEGAQASTANGPLAVGDPFLSLLNLPGMKAEWIDSDDTGTWYWTAGGLWFGVKPDSASITLAEKLSSPERPPLASDFCEDDLIGYIGTGIPF